MSTLIVMCGIPGSGKTTWCKKNLSSDIVYVSRDEVRFSLLKEGEDYFSHEKEVYAKFIEKIEAGLRADKTVVADATHLNPASRKKLLSSLKEKPDYIKAVVMNTSFNDACKRNDTRSGLSRVPLENLQQMKNAFSYPSKIEGFDEIIIVKNKGE